MTIESGPEWMETLSWAWYDLLLKQCRIRDIPTQAMHKPLKKAQPAEQKSINWKTDKKNWESVT